MGGERRRWEEGGVAAGNRSRLIDVRTASGGASHMPLVEEADLFLSSSTAAIERPESSGWVEEALEAGPRWEGQGPNLTEVLERVDASDDAAKKESFETKLKTFDRDRETRAPGPSHGRIFRVLESPKDDLAIPASGCKEDDARTGTKGID
ncbi:hypothetical protein THAOC_35291 [Thalassiosira oceanica]|uniref:Uncharacterized protein n=1 Tax=Thalassiosira oceanica TaxID=159749 RepID=K0R213_THAOC|nr:hypothetical protein THAOC_35291 [Thalassiosira oceanica]|eukprot:EJK46065.1 hypothetical protein THAOC_35291 [Thalassiosira oceanica]